MSALAEFLQGPVTPAKAFVVVLAIGGACSILWAGVAAVQACRRSSEISRAEDEFVRRVRESGL